MRNLKTCVTIVLVVAFCKTTFAFDEIQHSVGADGSDVWTIRKPNPKRRMSEYPSIRFAPRDRIVVEAGGCVNTHGAGKTTKRYVDPQGANSDRLYHGLIWIPAASPSAGRGLIRILGLIGQEQTIPEQVPDTAQLYLRLGYEDDQYDDNDYEQMDEGNPKQCTGEAAWVRLTVRHGQTPTPAPPPPPFNLVWQAVDANLLPLNPKWGWQVTHPDQLPDPGSICQNSPHLPPCTTQAPAIDNPGFPNSLICGFGQGNSHIAHVNWAAATYTGTLFWENKSAAPPFGDDDYNMLLQTAGNAGYTSQNAGGLGLEFQARETIDHFDTPWWSDFHKAVDSSDILASRMINGRHAIVTGLVGLDCEHECHTELHPVWAIAIHVKDDARDDTWAIFVRNWGNEGFCSQDQHYLDLPKDFGLTLYTFVLPARTSAQRLSVNGGLTLFKGSFQPFFPPQVRWDGRDSVFVTFYMPAPEAQGRINGELHIDWTAGLPLAVRDWALPAVAVKGPTVKKDSDDAEERLAHLRDVLTPQQKELLEGRLKTELRQPTVIDDVVLKEEVHVDPYIPINQPARVRAVRDLAKQREEIQYYQLLREVYGGNIPGWPTGSPPAPQTQPSGKILPMLNAADFKDGKYIGKVPPDASR